MGNSTPRITTQSLKVLGALMSSGMEELSGSEIARGTKLASGTLYPILFRLEQAGWLESRWEEADPHKLGRPRRRLYKITGIGAKNATDAFRDVTSAVGGFAWR
jgi:PadR family transcriptional regulator, regulatory protein PadR